LRSMRICRCYGVVVSTFEPVLHIFCRYEHEGPMTCILIPSICFYRSNLFARLPSGNPHALSPEQTGSESRARSLFQTAAGGFATRRELRFRRYQTGVQAGHRELREPGEGTEGWLYSERFELLQSLAGLRKRCLCRRKPPARPRPRNSCKGHLPRRGFVQSSKVPRILLWALLTRFGLRVLLAARPSQTNGRLLQVHREKPVVHRKPDVFRKGPRLQSLLRLSLAPRGKTSHQRWPLSNQDR
jgi:hypothetical protein